MAWGFFLGLALFAQNAHAMMRFACSQLVIERFDPLLTPGAVAPHLHQIVGGNAFNITMDPNNELPDLSTCTTCTYKEDTSNYWTAVLYFKHPNGTFKRVSQRANLGLGSANGGMTVYYIPPYDNSKVTAFKKGFRMIVGDAQTRSLNQNSTEARAVSFRCWEANWGGYQGAPGTGSDTYELPKKFCAGGIRTNIFFPTCWDGVNLDSPDHKSHVAWPEGNYSPVANLAGRCPKTHPVQLPQLFLETVWDTREFESMWPTDGSQPLLYSMGDPTGFGQHADYVFGWKGDALQRAMDMNCGPGSGCKALTAQSDADINRCSQTARVAEQVDGWLSALPGCNPIQGGPERAVVHGGCGAPTTYLPGQGANNL